MYETHADQAFSIITDANGNAKTATIYEHILCMCMNLCCV